MGSARTTLSSTISSATTITRRAANAASFCTPRRPQACAVPSAAARWAWTIATSGLSAGTAASRSPVYGQVTSRMRGFTRGRSLPVKVRSAANGSPAAPAAKRATIPKWLYSSSSSGCGTPSSTARRKAWSEPAPGLPAQLKTSSRAQPAAIIWS